jgi:hypothetical protein
MFVSANKKKLSNLLRNKAAKITWVSVLIIAILASGATTVGLLYYFSSTGNKIFSTTPILNPQGYHEGPITLYNYIYWTYDDSAQSSSVPTVKFYHSDKSNAIGTISSNTITGQLLPSDQDIIYMLADHGTNTGYFVDPLATISHGTPYIKDWFTWDDHGTWKYGFTIDLSKLLPQQLIAGQSSWTGTINLYVMKTNAVTDLVSITNSTSAVHTTTTDMYAQMYVSGFTGEGYGTKLAYLVTQVSGTGSNATYFTNGTVSLKDISVVRNTGDTHSLPGVGGFNDATNKTYIYPVSNWQNEAFDILMYNWRGGGGSSNVINLHYSALKWPGGAHRIRITVTAYFIDPTGAMTNLSQVIELRNSPYT